MLNFYNTHRLVRDLFIVTWSLIIFCKLIADFYCLVKTKHVAYKPLQYVSLIAIGFVFIGYIFSTIELFTSATVRYIFYICLNIAIIASYTVILLQLYYSFRSSMYRLTKRIFYFHFVIGLLCETFFILGAILDYLHVHPWKLYVAVIAGICFLIGIFQMVYAFNRNLFLVILSQRQTIESGDAQTQLNQRQLTVLQMIVKHTVLSSFEIGSYVLLSIIVVIIAIIDPVRKYDSGSIFRMWSFAAAIFVVSICIYLSFAMNNSLYYHICGKCDNSCRMMCEGFATNKLKERNQIEDTEL
eukprot:188634_1